ncbi:hypothetical protein [Aeromicrobium stalagmiti]|uniref:hypothetical protein n=1 Tax=Aeromicrobium stalagmiti TaxID=2738988 RepID=UPI001568BB97|nr:hypothetical protein [Aeromicrobium stalagmiti]NRQ50892.1 hypothetical protein [Aeromicrobium stalagmiti]
MRQLAVALLLAASPFLVGCDLSSATLEDDYTPSDRRYEEPEPTGPPADFERQQREYEQEQSLTPPAGKCADVTSYDDNWDNDVFCTREDGSQFYTSYDGANQFLAGY